jgi:hypothetical protein
MTQEELIKEINLLPVEQRQALLEASWQSMLNELSDSVLSETLRGLSPEDIKILFLFVAKEMSAEQIADVVGDNPQRLHYQLQKLRAKIQARARRYLNETGSRTSKEEFGQKDMRGLERNSDELTRSAKSRQETLSQRLYGILTFDGDPPKDEEVKDMISDYLIRKYS